jgi:hypothetical protein
MRSLRALPARTVRRGSAADGATVQAFAAMTRLSSELSRLFTAGLGAETGTGPAALVSADGLTRTAVLEVLAPVRWEVLGAVWRGVQTELQLPAPAIAVNGHDGMALWFSLARPIPVEQAHAFIRGLQSQFLQDLDPRSVRVHPAPRADESPQHVHAPLVPAAQADGDNWSAFVAPDLAPVFAETPWLDIAPSEEGQATLLAAIWPITGSDLAAAMARLEQPEAAQTTTPPRPPALRQVVDAAETDPRRFLLRVMNDESAALAMRIEAARVLLAHPAERGAS